MELNQISNLLVELLTELKNKKHLMPKRVYLREQYELLEPLYELEMALEHATTRMKIETIQEAKEYQNHVTRVALQPKLLPYEKRIYEHAKLMIDDRIWRIIFEINES